MKSLELSQPEHIRELNESKKRNYQELIQSSSASSSTTSPSERESKRLNLEDSRRVPITIKSKEEPEAFAEARKRGVVMRGRDGYDMLGVLRTKPGRIDSDMTLSMSCR
jgi:hypothetical protein